MRKFPKMFINNKINKTSLFIKGQVKSAFLCQPLKNTLIRSFDQNGQVIDQCQSNKKGQWALRLSPQIYQITFEKNGYMRKSIPFSKDFPSVIRLLEQELIGYQDKLWYSPGSLISAYIHSPFEFKAELFRYGYEVKKILDLGKHASACQKVPDGYFVSYGLNWERTIKYRLPENTIPGLYGLRLTLMDGSNNSYNIVFIVSSLTSPSERRARLLVLASTNTWQTYNIWGGRSRYRNFEAETSSTIYKFIHTLALKWTPESLKPRIKKLSKKRLPVSIADYPDAWQFKTLSINRPHPNCDIIDDDVLKKFTDHLAAGEWRVLAWLEREKINYDIISGFEFHCHPDVLFNYDAVILSTHCEYWSREMFEGLKIFHQKGGAILNLSGNSIYREINFKKNGSLQCTSLRFASTVDDESKILGVRFDMRGYGTSAPYKVIKADHWIFNGTNLKCNDIFAKSSLNKPSSAGGEGYDPSQPGISIAVSSSHDGGSGWETDKLTDTAPHDAVIVAKGMNPQNGGADMIVRDPLNGSGLAFSASSITFGGTLLIDEVSSKIIYNVIQKALH